MLFNYHMHHTCTYLYNYKVFIRYWIVWYKNDPMMGVSKYGRTAVISVPWTRVQRLSTQDWLTMINVSDACVTNRKGHYCWHALLWKTDHVITWCIWTMWQVVLWFSIRFMSLARLRQKKMKRFSNRFSRHALWLVLTHPCSDWSLTSSMMQ